MHSVASVCLSEFCFCASLLLNLINFSLLSLTNQDAVVVAKAIAAEVGIGSNNVLNLELMKADKRKQLLLSASNAETKQVETKHALNEWNYDQCESTVVVVHSGSIVCL